MNIKKINLEDYNYDLPKDRIAQYPVHERDTSKLLLLRDGVISKDLFKRIEAHIPAGSLLVFNNSRVIRARLLFGKLTGAVIEVLCLEPLSPAEYEASFQSTGAVEWKCIVGNLKKWKKGIIKLELKSGEKCYNLEAEKIQPEGEAWRIRFKWNAPTMNFGEVIEATGHIPLPPYINREDLDEDSINYQTIYSSRKGSVAAPTAGLHFTDHVLKSLRDKGIKSTEVTLHVGAGTFQPLKSNNIEDHEMHSERFFITTETLEALIEHEGKIIPVGTTSVRTIESIYWLGVKILKNPSCISKSFILGQWEAYNLDPSISVKESLVALINLMKKNNLLILHATTSIMIVPGYKFHMTNGLITNFHQPRSTLLLLVSALTGNKWKEIYKFAMENDFRFLSYGDCSLIFS